MQNKQVRTHLDSIPSSYLTSAIGASLRSIISNQAAEDAPHPAWLPILQTVPIPPLAASTAALGYSMALVGTERQMAVERLGRLLELSWIYEAITARYGAFRNPAGPIIRRFPPLAPTIAKALRRAAVGAGIVPWSPGKAIRMGGPLMAALMATEVFEDIPRYSKRLGGTLLAFTLAPQEMDKEAA